MERGVILENLSSPSYSKVFGESLGMTYKDIMIIIISSLISVILILTNISVIIIQVR